MTTSDLVSLASETSASMSTQHPDYARLAGRICISDNHKNTPTQFSDAISILYEQGQGFIHSDIADIVHRYSSWIDSQIQHDRDYDFTYFGFKTLLRSYLLQSIQLNPFQGSLTSVGGGGGTYNNKPFVVERPQYLFMRVALGIHCSKIPGNNNSTVVVDSNSTTFCPNDDLNHQKNDETNLRAAFETYDLMSRGYFTHASPTLFHSGTIHPQMSSCFLVQMSDDSIEGIYDTLKKCAVISKVRDLFQDSDFNDIRHIFFNTSTQVCRGDRSFCT